MTPKYRTRVVKPKKAKVVLKERKKDLELINKIIILLQLVELLLMIFLYLF